MKLLEKDSLLETKKYELHLFFKPSTSKEQIEIETSAYIEKIVMKNEGRKVHKFENHGKVDFYYQIKKNSNSLHYSWVIEINKSLMDIKTENLGIRLSRIQRKIVEQYEDSILRMMLLS
jgi:ribosomal protein S6